MDESRSNHGNHTVTLTVLELFALLIPAFIAASIPQYGYLPSDFFSHLLLLSVVSMIVVVVTELWTLKLAGSAAIVIHFLYWFFLHYPLAAASPLPTLVATVLLLRTWRKASPAVAFTISALLIYSILRSGNGGIAWGTTIPGKASGTVVAEAAIVILLMGVGITLLRAITSVERLMEQRSELNSTVDHLSAANVGFQRIVQSIAEKTKQEERERITRDIHDSIGYTVSNVIVMLDAAVGLVERDPQRATKIMKDARAQADRGHREIRKALHTLRALEDADIFGLRSLERVTTAFSEATGVSVLVDFGNMRQQYDGIIESAIYRFVQEGMTNAFRHGKATRIETRMFQTDSEIIVNLTDNGNGADQIEEGIGIIGMRERMSQVDGTISFENSEHGFRICARIPCRSETRVKV